MLHYLLAITMEWWPRKILFFMPIFYLQFNIMDGNSTSYLTSTPSVSLETQTIRSPLPEEVCPENRCYRTEVSDHDRRCKCDPQCHFYGDCCSDRAGQRLEKLSCQQILGAPPAEFGYYVIDNCPTGTDEIIHRQCKDEPLENEYVKVEVVAPIRDRDGFWYKNIFCALCNDVHPSDIEVETKLQQNCTTCPDVVLPMLPQYYINLGDQSCIVAINTVGEIFRSCSGGFVSDCPVGYQDLDTASLCRNYMSPGRAPDGNLYRNPHCAICNNVELNDFRCISPADSTSYPMVKAGADIFAWDIGGFFFLEAVPESVSDEDSEIIRLTQCEQKNTTQAFLTLHVNQGSMCPYLGKRVDLCAGLVLDGVKSYDDSLPWDQLVLFPDEEPFPSDKNMLMYKLPKVLLSRGEWTWIVAAVMNHLEEFSEKCMFNSMEVFTVCDDISTLDDITGCDRLIINTNSTEIVLRDSGNGERELMNPETLAPLGNVAWLGFVLELNQWGYDLQTTGTQVCLVKETTTEPMVGIKTSFPSPIERRYAPLLWFFSNVCVVISIVCLSFTFFTYCLFGELRSNFGLILMNFVGSLALAQLLTHFVTDYVTTWRLICQLSAVAAHLFWLVTFAWMNLMAWNLKATFSKPAMAAAGRHSRRTVIGYCCYGWLLPITLVGMCVILYRYFDAIPVTYGLIGGITCWIGPGVVALSVVGGPLLVTILVNGILFALVVIGIRSSRFRLSDGDGPQSRRKDIFELLIYLKISLLMGFIWSFGFLIEFDSSGTLIYLYYICQAVQGILIMLFFTLNKRVRSLWMAKLRCTKKSKSRRTSSIRETTM